MTVGFWLRHNHVVLLSRLVSNDYHQFYNASIHLCCTSRFPSPFVTNASFLQPGSHVSVCRQAVSLSSRPCPCPGRLFDPTRFSPGDLSADNLLKISCRTHASTSILPVRYGFNDLIRWRYKICCHETLVASAQAASTRYACTSLGLLRGRIMSYHLRHPEGACISQLLIISR